MKTSTALLPPLRSVKGQNLPRERIHYLHYRSRTEQACIYWVTQVNPADSLPLGQTSSDPKRKFSAWKSGRSTP